MIISSSQLSMDASSGHMDVSRTKGGKILSRNHSGRTDPFNLNIPDLKDLFKSSHRAEQTQTREVTSTTEPGAGSSHKDDTPAVLQDVIEKLTGINARISPRKTEQSQESTGSSPSAPFMGLRRYYRIGGQQVSLNFSAQKVQYEYEYLNFSSSGAIATADGRNIDFSLELSVQRTQVVRQSLLGGLTAGYFIDPLVLNFKNDIDLLSDHYFNFDLDSDGRKELLPGLPAGTGFLALDRNGDKIINNGQELFGPVSGSGFSELLQHDLDKNNWIDENDPIFNQLLVWLHVSGDKQELIPLKEAGVGAISLSNSPAMFNLKSRANEILGQVSSSGIFLMEDGTAKSIHDLNLATDEKGEESDGPRDQHLLELREQVAAHRRRLSDFLLQHQYSVAAGKDEKTERWDPWGWLKGKQEEDKA